MGEGEREGGVVSQEGVGELHTLPLNRLNGATIEMLTKKMPSSHIPLHS